MKPSDIVISLVWKLNSEIVLFLCIVGQKLKFEVSLSYIPAYTI
jgi:hypothetical protein